MIWNLNEVDVEVLSAAQTDALVAEDGEVSITGSVKVRVQLDDKQVKALPFVAAAVAKLLKISREVEEDDGPNSVFVSVKRTFPEMLVTLDRMVAGKSAEESINESVQFGAKVKGQPKIGIVDGAASMTTKLSISESAEVWGTILAGLRREGVKVSSALAPTPMFGDSAEVSEAA